MLIGEAEANELAMGWDHDLRRPAFAQTIGINYSGTQTPTASLKRRAVKRLFAQGQPAAIKVITRFNLADFAGGVSEIAALHRLLEAGAQLRGVRNLHSKLYLFGSSRVIVTSANSTEAALLRNHEFGFVAADTAIIEFGPSSGIQIAASWLPYPSLGSLQSLISSAPACQINAYDRNTVQVIAL